MWPNLSLSSWKYIDFLEVYPGFESRNATKNNPVGNMLYALWNSYIHAVARSAKIFWLTHSRHFIVGVAWVLSQWPTFLVLASRRRRRGGFGGTRVKPKGRGGPCISSYSMPLPCLHLDNNLSIHPFLLQQTIDHVYYNRIKFIRHTSEEYHMFRIVCAIMPWSI